ncbi:alpha/beta hydrolase family protein [Actinomycetospora lemnae]|uniref:Alpha/beta hydrolase family protein n=1 Tax=Actinomycetospora lemnae TaxID=3019891 RepID=A0ABT5SR68_9PSEU|nr:hypothetical protein [Actinomycetospora sp. DW7H6]MDD7964970.1 hypothetical protein [Actinomycetospora sp. DW7H6]
MLVWLVRVLAVVWLLGVLVVAVGTYAPRLPVVGFLRSFVTGQYPLHAALAALAGVGLGVLARVLGARTDGAVVAGVALVAVVALVGVLVTQARASDTRIDWWQALTVTGQPDGGPDRTEPYAVDELGRPLVLDLYRPTGPGAHPVVVWVHRALRAAGVPGRLVEVPHADHVFDFPFGSPGAQATRPQVAAFLAEHVGTRTP